MAGYSSHSLIDISIVVMTYYHERYISQALDSLLNQETSYRYEIVVCDDCSHDKTKEIVEKYVENNPMVIRAFYNENNLGIPRNLYEARCRCRGRYICGLSGDDWLTDTHKLQRQAEFLDCNPDYFAVSTSVGIWLDGAQEPYRISPPERFRGCEITVEQYLKYACVGTGTVMFRNVFLTEEGRRDWSLMVRASSKVDDVSDALLMFSHGRIYSLDYCPHAYRVQVSKQGKHNYNSINTSIQGSKNSISAYNYLDKHLSPHYDLFFRYSSNVATMALLAIRYGELREFVSIYKSIPKSYRRRFLLIRSVPQMFFRMASYLKKRTAVVKEIHGE